MSVEPFSRRAVFVPSVEMILQRINCEAYALTAHLPRRRRAEGYLLKAMELIAADVAVWPMQSEYTPSQAAQLLANRRVAQEIIRTHVPSILQKLKDD